mgnify:CR=1 FL=1
MPVLLEGVDVAALALADTPQAGTDAATAIMTTDTRPKTASATLPGGARIVGMAKGSGIIHPDMATMFAFAFTDAQVERRVARRVEELERCERHKVAVQDVWSRGGPRQEGRNAGHKRPFAALEGEWWLTVQTR